MKTTMETFRRNLGVLCVAFAACAFLSCSKAELENYVLYGPSYTVHVHAGDGSDPTKSSFGQLDNGGYESYWSGNENVAFMINTDEAVAATADGSGRSTEFAPTFSTSATSGTLYAFSPYYQGKYSDAACAGFTTINVANAKSYNDIYLCVPAAQTPLANSVDEGAHIVVAKYDFSDGLPEEIDMDFEHAIAYGRMTIRDFDHDIATVSITFPSNVAGTSFYYYFATGAIGNVTSSKNTSTITLTATNVVDNVFWFGCVPNTVAVGSTLSFAVTDTDGVVYAKDVTIKNKDLVFEKGKVSKFAVSIPAVLPDQPADGDVYVAYSRCYEMPAFTAANPNAAYSTKGTSSSYGDYWLTANTTSSKQTYVVHRFVYNNATLRNYSMLFDADKRCALWVSTAYHSVAWPDLDVGRGEEWGYDPALSRSIQPNLSSSYTGSYDRGHQVASNDRQTTDDQNAQTFYYSNMSPQYSTLNRGQWGQLEAAVQSYGATCSGLDTLYMVTGPVFESGYSTTTDASDVACPIPTKFYKCLMKCTFNASGTMTKAVGVAYLTPGNSASSNTSYSGWITTIDAVEALTGFDFFTNVPADLQTAAEKTKSSLF